MSTSIRRITRPAGFLAALAVPFLAQGADANDVGMRRIAPHVAVDRNPDIVEVFLTAKEKMVQIGQGKPTKIWT
jgi:hypothetical protein